LRFDHQIVLMKKRPNDLKTHSISNIFHIQEIMRLLHFLSFVSLSSAFLLPSLPSSSSPLSKRGRALASSASEELSRKEKSKEQVRSLLKGLGELDDEDGPSESGSSKRKVRGFYRADVGERTGVGYLCSSDSRADFTFHGPCFSLIDVCIIDMT